MIQWGASDQVNVGNLNKAFAWDAIVVEGATPSGSIYATVDAAIDAGAKSIFVKAGEHVGFTADVDGLYIVGEGVPEWNHGTLVFEEYGTRFTSTIAVEGDHVTLVNLVVKTAAGSGFLVTGTNAFLQNCQGCGCADAGVDAGGTFPVGANLRLFGCYFIYNIGPGIRLHTTYNQAAWIVGCKAAFNGDSGIKFTVNTTKEVMITGCYLDANTGYGINAAAINTAGCGRIGVSASIIIDNTVGAVLDTTGAAYTSGGMVLPALASFTTAGNFKN